MDQAAKGKQLLEQSKFEDAIVAYTEALRSSPTSPQYLLGRSTAYHRAGKHSEALSDAEAAVVHANTRAKREQIIEAQTRRGIALYKLERYADAKLVLNIVKRMDAKEKTHTMFLQMSESKLKGMAEDDEAAKVTVTELPTLSAAQQAQKDIPDAKPQAPAVQPTPKDKIRHDWYQNNEHVYFTLLAKGVPKEKAQVDVQERSFNISFPIGDTGSDYDFTIDPLFAAIIPDRTTTRVLATKVEVVLVKATPGRRWSKLESTDPVNIPITAAAKKPEEDLAKRAVLTAAAPTTASTYPTSSKNGPKNWDNITTTELDENDEIEGGDEANHFFKKLFKDSTPDVQRAMMKSYTESNGTALSTNWGEVSRKTMETSPPDGMEAKKY